MTRSAQPPAAVPTAPPNSRARTVSKAVPHVCEAVGGICPVAELQAALAREAALLRERDALIERQTTLSREADHRFLNNVQMISSLISMQSRIFVNKDCAPALAMAANRVAMMGQIHRHLHSIDGVESVAFKTFLEVLCLDYATMLLGAGRCIIVEGDELQLPTAVAVPLGFVINELITNALKYGQDPIKVRLAPDPRMGFAIFVENGGPALPEGFDPAKSKGLGMRIVRSLVIALGGELRTGCGENNQGARFAVHIATPESLSVKGDTLSAGGSTENEQLNTLLAARE